MDRQEPTFNDFITDKDGDYSKAQFIALADKLIREGRRPGRVFLAMYRAAGEASAQHSIGEHLDFIVMVQKETAEYRPQLEAQIDGWIEEDQQKH